MAGADVWGQVERCLRDPAEYQLSATPGIATPPELHVVVPLGDPSDEFANVVWNPATVTVGDQVIAEGLAEAFVRGRYGTCLSAADILRTAGVH